MPAYDDTKTIEQVRRLMAKNEGMSRRAAILEVAGPDNLRRIEIKMKGEAAAAAPAGFRDRRRLERVAEAYGAERVSVTWKAAHGDRFWATVDGTGADMLLGMHGGMPPVDDMLLPDHRLDVYHRDGTVVALFNRSTGKGYVTYPATASEALVTVLCAVVGAVAFGVMLTGDTRASMVTLAGGMVILLAAGVATWMLERRRADEDLAAEA